MAKYFKASEFVCNPQQCGCGFGLNLGDIDPRLLDILDVIREATGAPITVNSGCRCQRHNARVGGVVAVKYYVPGTRKLDLSKYPRGAKGGPKDSNHTHGTAADIKCVKLNAKQLYDLILRLHKAGKLPQLAGIGIYDTFVHVDVNPKVAGRLRMWDERTKK